MNPLGRPASRGPASRRSGWVGPSTLLALCLPILLAGCGTGGLAVKKDIWDAQTDFEQRQTGLSEKVLELEGRVGALDEQMAALQFKLDEMAKQIAGLDTDFSRGLEAVRDGQQQLGIELEGKIRAVDSARKSDREDILARIDIVLNEVTSENQRLRAEIEAVKATRTGSAHVVKPGETLASIAAKYGVTVSDLIAANKIQNPDIIPVGAKLVIPGK
jgi:nucleoid-associated protein YgaU